MKFGLHYQLACTGNQSPVQRYRDTIEQAVHAETLGFESVWPVEQHFNAPTFYSPGAAPVAVCHRGAHHDVTPRDRDCAVALVPSHPCGGRNCDPRCTEQRPRRVWYGTGIYSQPLQWFWGSAGREPGSHDGSDRHDPPGLDRRTHVFCGQILYG